MRTKLKADVNSEQWPIELDRDRSTQSADLSFTTVDFSDMDLSSTIRAFIPDDLVGDGGRIPTGDAVASFIVTTEAEKPVRLAVRACFSPPSSIGAGLYKGTLQVSGRTIEPISIPVTVSVKDRNLWLPIVALVAGSLFGLALKIVSAMKQTSEISWSGVREYISTAQFILAILLGIAGLGGLWLKLYVPNETFSADFSHLWPLAVGAAGAFVISPTITDLFKSNAGG